MLNLIDVFGHLIKIYAQIKLDQVHYAVFVASGISNV